MSLFNDRAAKSECVWGGSMSPSSLTYTRKKADHPPNALEVNTATAWVTKFCDETEGNLNSPELLGMIAAMIAALSKFLIHRCAWQLLVVPPDVLRFRVLIDSLTWVLVHLQVLVFAALWCWICEWLLIWMMETVVDFVATGSARMTTRNEVLWPWV